MQKQINYPLGSAVNGIGFLSYRKIEYNVENVLRSRLICIWNICMKILAYLMQQKV